MALKDNFGPIICTFVCVFLIQLGLIIPSLYFGYLEEYDDCQLGTRGNINLSDWNKIFGFEKLGFNFVFGFFGGLVILTGIESMLFFPGLCLFVDVVFNFMWWIWGVILLSTKENRDCVADEKGIAIAAIINLILASLWFLPVKIVLRVFNDSN